MSSIIKTLQNDDRSWTYEECDCHFVDGLAELCKPCKEYNYKQLFPLGSTLDQKHQSDAHAIG